MKTIEYNLPSFYLSALFNDDTSSLNDDDIKSLDAFISDCVDEHGHFHAIETSEDLGFMKYHDLQSYGVLACDCETVIFDVERV
tara:strand:- start:451 stop:702 length:252 start_codon:yes stop_codon:yes gene_type:complete